jgi:hypothetical protein
VRQWLPAPTPVELLLRDSKPELVDELHRIGLADVSKRELQVLGPEPLPRFARQLLVADNEVQLRVVE